MAQRRTILDWSFDDQILIENVAAQMRAYSTEKFDRKIDMWANQLESVVRRKRERDLKLKS